MKSKLKVTVVYIGSFRHANAHDYKITKIVGAPTVEIIAPGDAYGNHRIGDLLDEKQASALAGFVELTTLPKA